jgi:hypothetical protein
MSTTRELVNKLIGETTTWPRPNVSGWWQITWEDEVENLSGSGDEILDMTALVMADNERQAIDKAILSTEYWRQAGRGHPAEIADTVEIELDPQFIIDYDKEMFSYHTFQMPAAPTPDVLKKFTKTVSGYVNNVARRPRRPRRR